MPIGSNAKFYINGVLIAESITVVKLRNSRWSVDEAMEFMVSNERRLGRFIPLWGLTELDDRLHRIENAIRMREIFG